MKHFFLHLDISSTKTKLSYSGARICHDTRIFVVVVVIEWTDCMVLKVFSTLSCKNFFDLKTDFFEV